jgi:hypothetical protein
MGVDAQDLPVRSRSIESLPNSTISDRLLPFEDRPSPVTERPREAPSSSTLVFSSPVTRRSASEIGGSTSLMNLNPHAPALHQHKEETSGTQISIESAMKVPEAANDLSRTLHGALAEKQLPDQGLSEEGLEHGQDRGQASLLRAGLDYVSKPASQAASPSLSPTGRARWRRANMMAVSDRGILIPIISRHTQTKRLKLHFDRQNPSSTSLSRYRVAKLSSRRRRATFPSNRPGFIVT